MVVRISPAIKATIHLVAYPHESTVRSKATIHRSRHEEKKMGHTPIHCEEKRKKDNHRVWAKKYGLLTLICLFLHLLVAFSEKKGPWFFHHHDIEKKESSSNE
jgi:hypothetical protein